MVLLVSAAGELALGGMDWTGESAAVCVLIKHELLVDCDTHNVCVTQAAPLHQKFRGMFL